MGNITPLFKKGEKKSVLIIDHWDDVYSKEVENFQDNGDVGEVWFGYESVERVIKWLQNTGKVPQNSHVLDIGCGNGIMLTELAKLGYSSLTGVDYSEGGVKLAQGVAQEEGVEITYQVGDILCDLDQLPSRSCLTTPYDVCIDKGTYDAIGLNPENGKLHREKYCQNILKLLKPGAIFVITSCNWTAEELKESFKNGLKFQETIPTPTFTFGGVTGNRETALVFSRES